MKTNELIYANTHAEFLNKAFGTTYKGWMKAYWIYNEYMVWMIRFDGNVRDGWKNIIISDKEIEEENSEYNEKIVKE